MLLNETLNICPLCGIKDRTLMHGDLEDTTFRAAGGLWSLWRCNGCECAYLDPRPNLATIGEAYRNYYTHENISVSPSYEMLSPLRKVHRKLANGYVAWRYGVNVSPRSSLGIVAAALIPRIRRVIDMRYRHLHGKGSVLDVGCGNGEFLARAKACGWDTHGIDPDASAVAKAQNTGAQVQVGGLELFEAQSARFDVITMNNVIEHFHDPISALRDSHRLLKPGGILWLVTPNIDSFGHTRYGKFWRGLEAPRHLVLFNEHSMWEAARRVGFSRWRRLPDLNENYQMARKSYAMTLGRSPYDSSVKLPRAQRAQAMKESWQAAFCPTKREFLAMVFSKS